jgi:hypothetical protein
LQFWRRSLESSAITNEAGAVPALRRALRIKEIAMRISIPLLLSVSLTTTAVCSAQAVSAIPDNAGQRLQGDGVAVEIRDARSRFEGLRVTDQLASRTLDLPQAFALTMKDGTVLRSSAMQIGPLAVGDLPLAGAASHDSGKRICADFSDPNFSGQLRWCLSMRAHAAYIRQELTIEA